LRGTSNSTGEISNPASWVLENGQFFWIRVKGIATKRAGIARLLAEIDGYVEVYREATGRDLRDARVLEIGYGARPLRLIAMQSLGFDAVGIDLDRPTLGSVSELLEIYRRNGVRRFIKSAIRHVLFDGHERSTLRAALRSRGSQMRIYPSRFLVGDAAQFPFEPQSADFIFSEDVFEHIPREQIHALCSRLARVLTADGIAMITPCIFTGINGGHLVEWYPNTLMQNRKRRTEPWEHLRKRRVRADCYLNELRLSDYQEIFSEYFEVVRIIDRDKGIGRQFLTPAIRQELAEFSVDELLCNRVTYLLKLRRSNN